MYTFAVPLSWIDSMWQVYILVPSANSLVVPLRTNPHPGPTEFGGRLCSTHSLILITEGRAGALSHAILSRVDVLEKVFMHLRLSCGDTGRESLSVELADSRLTPDTRV